MKRVPFSLLVIILLLTAALPASASAQNGQDEAKLFPLEIRNRSASPVTVLLLGPNGLAAYALNVSASSQRLFTVREGLYDQTTLACGDTAKGKLDVSQQLRLVFTACPGEAPNWGAPTIEKIHLFDSPKGILWRYQYAPPMPPPPAPIPPVSSSCTFTATDTVTIYRLPDFASNVFSTVGSGFSMPLNSRTAGGWLGFDPGYAQAGNIGPFHNRWIPPDAPVSLSSGCNALPVVWGPPPGVCFVTPGGGIINIYAQPDTSATVAGQLHANDFAAVLGNTANMNWTKVDLSQGNTGQAVTGWVEQNKVFTQGSCGSIPVINP
jgi:hypothetical protein